jgi:uncharacterized membrane protein
MLDPGPLANLLQLGLVGLSVALFGFELGSSVSPGAFVLENRLPPGDRSVLFRWLAAASLAAPLGGMLVFLFLLRGPWRRREVAFHRGVLRLRPAMLLFLVPVLLDRRMGRDAPLLVLGLGLAATYACARWLPVRRRSRPQLDSGLSHPWRARLERASPYLLAAAAVGYVGFTSVASIWRHHALLTQAYDLGIFENVLFTTLQGRILHSPLEQGSHLAVHFSPILLALVPAYALVPRTEVLLVAQSLLIGATAWPLFLVARHALRSSTAALLIGLCFLAHPAVAGANLYDFHELAFGPVLFVSAFYFVLTERWIPCAVAVGLLLLVKEDMTFVVMLLGLYALASRKAAAGGVLLAVGAAANLLIYLVVLPAFGARSFAWYYRDLAAGGEGLGAIVRTAVTNPLFVVRLALSEPKALYALQVLLPLTFLGLRELRSWLLVSYGLTAALAASWAPMHSIGFQYALQVVPAVLVAATMELGGGGEGRRRARRLARPTADRTRRLFGMVVLSALCTLQFGAFAPGACFLVAFGAHEVARPDATAKARYEEVRRIAREIPQGASVTASEELVPHVARRMDLTTLRYAHPGAGWGADYLFVTQFERHENLAKMLAAAPYVVMAEGRYVRLLANGARTLPASPRGDAP